MKDFFFGEMKRETVSLREFIALSQRIPRDFFTGQVNRLLSQLKNNTLVLQDDTSMPPFPSLLDNIDTDQIGLLEISPRDYPSSPCITSVLTCKLVLPQGCLEVQANWTSYKAIRSDELISTLLDPLLRHGLRTRTNLMFDDECRPLDSYDTEGMINALFELTGDRLDETDRMSRYTKLVLNAELAESEEG